MPTQYAVVSVAEPERHVRVLPTGSEAGIMAGRLNEEARQREEDARYRVIPVATPDDPTESSWQQREQARFDSGQYTAVPWADEPWAIREHYAHVSTERPSELSFTLDDTAGASDRQMRITPGRYLMRYHHDTLTSSQIRNWSARWSIAHEGLTVRFATTESEIERVYRNGPHSCMAYAARNYSTNGVHPTRVYAAGDLAIAHLERDGTIMARAICWPERHIFGRIYDGDDGRLQALLEAEGYHCGEQTEDWNDARLQLRRVGSNHAIVCPYLDSPNYTVTVDLEAQCLRIDNNGNTPGQSTAGAVSFRFPADAPIASATATTVTIPRFSQGNGYLLRQLIITYVEPHNPHRPDTPTYDNWAQFVGSEGMTLWDLWRIRRVSPSHLNYRVNRGYIRVGPREV